MNLLLHICCGPCSLMPVLRLREMGHTVTGLFVNPNIQPLAEYLRRREAAAQAAERLNLPMIWQDDWDLPAWIASLGGGERNGPGSDIPRCDTCYAQRLHTAARLAAGGAFDGFCSSLLYSRYQLHDHIIRQGNEAAERHGAVFFYADFRADWQQGIELSKEWGLYRQNYCGCVFSEAERFQRAFERVRESAGSVLAKRQE